MASNTQIDDCYIENSSEKYINRWIGNYYCGFNGKYVKNQWVKTSGKQYYYDNNGKYLQNKYLLL